jgi:hypothetical protein
MPCAMDFIDFSAAIFSKYEIPGGECQEIVKSKVKNILAKIVLHTILN